MYVTNQNWHEVKQGKAEEYLEKSFDIRNLALKIEPHMTMASYLELAVTAPVLRFTFPLFFSGAPRSPKILIFVGLQVPPDNTDGKFTGRVPSI